MVESAVYIEWTLEGAKTYCSTGGVVCHKDSEGLYILSTCHQLNKHVVNNDVNTLRDKKFEIEVTFFDRGRHFDGKLLSLCMLVDLTLIKIPLTKSEFSTLPISRIQPALFSKDPLYPRQLAYAVHHPEMAMRDSFELLYFQQTAGYIVDPEYHIAGEPKRVHYEIDLVMSGSSGSPIFEQNSNKVLGMVCGVMCGRTHEGATAVNRRYAISLETIRTFLQGSHISV